MTEPNGDVRTQRGDHPEELLAGLVDGTLDDHDRERVEAHLSDCSICREELPLALRAATAVARLPEVDGPPGMTRTVVDAARPPSSRKRNMAWVAAPVAAAVVGLALWAGLAGGGSAAREGAEGHASGGGGGGQAAPVPATVDHRIRILNENFTPAKIQALAAGLTSRQKRAVLSSGGGRKDQDAVEFSGMDPIRCIQATAEPTSRDHLLEVLVARFEGTPAYIAVFEHRPGAGQVPSLLTIWVASAHGCRLLHYASEPLNR